MRFTTQQAGLIVAVCFTLPGALSSMRQVPWLELAASRAPLLHAAIAYSLRMMKEKEKLSAERKQQTA